MIRGGNDVGHSGHGDDDNHCGDGESGSDGANGDKNDILQCCA